jgi:hypothetical protein
MDDNDTILAFHSIIEATKDRFPLKTGDYIYEVLTELLYTAAEESGLINSDEVS